MVARTLWLWLSVGWLIQAVLSHSEASICGPGSPCRCVLGTLTCDCSTSFLKEVVLKESLLDPSFSSISVANCFHVHVTANALSGMAGLQQVNIDNVRQVTLEERAFNWTTRERHHTGLVINVTNSNLQQVPSHCFRGFIRNVLLSAVNISRINTYAFSAIDDADRFELNRVNVKEVETQSFKRVSVGFLTIVDSSFSTLPERAVLDVAVHQEVRLYRVKINRLDKSSVKINSSRNFRLIKCTFGYVESNAFELRTKGDVSIHGNIFSYLESQAFASISVENKYLKEAGKQDFVFENNTLIQFENESLKLNTSCFDPRLDWIMVKQKCSCDVAQSWGENLVVFSSVSPKGNHPGFERLIYCLGPKPTSVKDFQRLSCIATRFSVSTIVVGVVLVVIALSVIVLVVFCGVKKRGKKYINVPTAASELKSPADNKAHMLVVPDGKTYRETELHVILEHADAIKTVNFVKGRPEDDTTG